MDLNKIGIHFIKKIFIKFYYRQILNKMSISRFRYYPINRYTFVVEKEYTILLMT